MNPRAITLLVLFGLSLAGSAQVQHQVTRVQRDWETLRRFHDTELSTNGIARLRTYLDEAQERLGKVEFGELNREAQVDWILLDRQIEARRAALSHDLAALAADAEFVPFVAPVLELEARRRGRDGVDPPRWAKIAATIPERVKAARSAVEARQKKAEAKPKEEGEGSDGDAGSDAEPDPEAEAGLDPLPKWHLFRLAGRAKACERRLDDWYKHYAIHNPGFDWWLKKPVEDAKRELSEYDKWLREKMAGIKDRDNAPPFGEAVGAERLAELIGQEFIAYTPEELLALAEREFAWCEEQQTVAAEEMGFDDWKAALDRVKDQHVPPGGQADYVAEQAREAIRFCDERELVTIPALCRETWRVRMVDEKAQKTLPYAAYGGLNVLVAYAAGGMGHDDKLSSMRGNNRHTTRVVTAHEVIPGHHLQSYYAARHRPYRRTFSTPFFVEGWALYWEMRLWDLGFTRGPEDRIGFLFWRKHRCARIIVTLKFHLGEMAPKEMVDFLVERVGHERPQATSEVRRYIAGRYGALYQAAYMLGGKQLQALHGEIVGAGRMTEKLFHDRILRMGPIPVDLVRALLVEEVELSPTYRTDWRF